MFTADQLTSEEKAVLVASYDEEKLVVSQELLTLERQQSVRESDIDVALSVMRDIDKQWLLAAPAEQRRSQSQLFPQGFVYDYENHRFGTTQISTLYRVIPNKKDLPVSEKSFLVAGAGFEPATLWL